MPRYEKGDIVPGSIPDRLLEQLQADQGWLSVWILVDEVGSTRNTVERALYRLQAAGRVQHRTLELALTASDGHNGGGAQYDTVSEWRAK